LKILPVTRFKDPKSAILTLKNDYRKPPVILQNRTGSRKTLTAFFKLKIHNEKNVLTIKNENII
jgi:hypothetical protein